MNNDCLNINQYPGGIFAVDSGLFRDRMACCYLVEDQGEAALIEVGGSSGASRLLSTLEWRGIAKEQVCYVIVTHVHLDHAGGAGQLMQSLPNATLLVHPRGAKHMIDPSRLEAGARAVYGEQLYEETYGSLVPIEGSRVQEMDDGDSVSLGSRTFRFMDTPGHASHHFSVHDSLSNGWFTGDTFGLSYRELDTEKGPFVFPTTTPIDFNPDALRESINRLISSGPEWMYLTHFGRIAASTSLAEKLIAGVNLFERWGIEFEHEHDRIGLIRQAMIEWLTKEARAHGIKLPNSQLLDVVTPDIELNIAGIDVWLNRRAKARP